MKIFLLGLMGTGKTYWTKRLSKKLKVGGYDLDQMIEAHEEKTISEMFAEEGEDHFRKTESKILRWFGEKKSFVIEKRVCIIPNTDPTRRRRKAFAV